MQWTYVELSECLSNSKGPAIDRLSIIRHAWLELTALNSTHLHQSPLVSGQDGATKSQSTASDREIHSN